MKPWTMLLPATMFAVVASCSSEPPAKPPAKLCVANSFVFCRCADLRDGSKQCSADGQSFTECDCGEAPDTAPEDTNFPPEDTGEPVDAPPASLEKCPGKTVAVDPMKEVTITGDTTGAANDSVGGSVCAVAAGGDHVYAIVPTGSGRLVVKMTGTGTMDPTPYVRGENCESGSQLACGETTGAGGSETFSINVIAAKTYYLFADGKAGTSGPYTITLNLTTGTFCGDGSVDSPEGCDDGNKVSGDGCENDCRPSGSTAASDSCPGVPAHVWPGRVLSISGDTSAANLSYSMAASTSPSCTSTGSSAPDRVYAVVAHKTGTMTIEVDAMYNTAIYVRASPCDTGTQLSCANNVGGTGAQTETMSFAVSNGQTYYLVVDGALAYKGAFTARLAIP